MRHPLTIDLEEHFQLAWAGRGIPRRHWDRLPSRLERNVAVALDLLQRTGTKATFFVGDWVAARYPEVVADVAHEGHEIACSIERRSASHWSEVVQLLETVSAQFIHGCRIGGDLTVGAEGRKDIAAAFDYESSFTAAVPWSRATEPCSIPIRSIRIAGQVWPAESLRLRQAPNAEAVRHAASWARSEHHRPLSFRLWELDDEFPRLAVMSPLHQWLCYRNLPTFGARVQVLLNEAEFLPARSVLGLAETRRIQTAARSEISARLPAPAPAESASDPLTVVVPCFNEEEGLPYLEASLAVLSSGLGRRCRLSFVLVDDGSTDGTWQEMVRLFGSDTRFLLVRHDRNRGVAAAILTGVAAAETEVVAVIDSDCSYDPTLIEEMLPLLGPGVALVTASPYHPLGGVEGVPGWRLVLSRGASRLYRLVLTNKLATYTSCFRIYRRSAIDRLSLRYEDFIGVAETLARLDREGWRIAEHPVVLETRLFGQSKLKVIQVIIGHLRLLSELGIERLMSGRATAHSQLTNKDRRGFREHVQRTWR